MVAGGLTSYLSGESLASASTGVLFKRRNLVSKQAFQRARKGFLSLPRDGESCNEERISLFIVEGFFQLFWDIGVCDLCRLKEEKN